MNSEAFLEVTRLLSRISFPLKLVLDDTSTPSYRQPESIGGIVIHTAQCGEVSSAAENLADWATGPQGPRASWNYAVDNDSATQSVPLQHIAWHAGTVNRWTIGIELAGKAEQSAAQWRDDFSTKQLQLAAQLVAVLCDVCGLPIVRATDSEISTAQGVNGGTDRAYKVGLFGHVDANRAMGKKGHWDPGPSFPWDWFLEMVREGY